MKGGIAGELAAMIAVRRRGIPLRKTAMFAGVIGEEECSTGTEHLIKTGILPRYAVVAEPSDLQVCTTHKGFEWMQVTMIGRSCHGSRPKEGKNAIYAAAHFCDLVQQKLEEAIAQKQDNKLGTGTVCVGVVSGGHDPNIVPDRCTLQLDRRWLPDERLADVHAEVATLAESAAEAYGCQYEFRPLEELRASMVNAPYRLSETDVFAVSCKEIVSGVLGRPQEFGTFQAWTDAGLLSNHSDAKCVILGPGNINQAHANNEFCSLEDIYLAAEMYYQMILEFCV